VAGCCEHQLRGNSQKDSAPFVVVVVVVVVVVIIIIIVII
jgi:hypothetical protein